MPLPRPNRFQKKKKESSSESSSSEEEELEIQKPTSQTAPDDRPRSKKKFELVPDDAEEDDDEESIGVIRASQQSENKATLDLEKGTIKNLAHMFQNITHSPDPMSKQPFKMDLEENEGEIVLESTPLERFEGVVRSADPSEQQKPIDVERGATKNLASRFLNRTMEDTQASKKPFKMDIDESAEPIVLESEPVVLEGVVRSSDKQEEIRSKKGRIKNLAKGFVSLAQGESQDGEKGEMVSSRTVGQRWRDSQQEGGEMVRGQIELDAATDFGVYENEPEVRDDVVRAGEDQPDVIHVKHTRNLKKMWCQFEKSEIEKEQNSKNIDFRGRKREVTPPPSPPREPTPPPKEEPKKKSWAARRRENQKSAISPPVEQITQKPSLRPSARRRL